MKEVREKLMQISRGRAFLAEETAPAKVLRSECVWHIQGTARQGSQGIWGRDCLWGE